MELGRLTSRQVSITRTEVCNLESMDTQDPKTLDISAEIVRIREVYSLRRTNVPAQRYSYFNDGQLLMIQEMEQRLLQGLKQHGCVDLHHSRILDIGCGNGFWLARLVSWGAVPSNLCGIDLIPDRIQRARELLPSGLTLEEGSATQLNFPANSFELVLQFTVFSSILSHEMRVRVAHEMLRVLKPGGYIVWYDFHMNNPKNRNTRAVHKEEIRHLFGECSYDFRRITVAAPLVRVLAPLSLVLCQVLAACKALSTHYLVFIQKPRS